jgi:hypothetical protein
MAVYRIFTNDRGKQKGVPMYSGLMDVEADDPHAAKKQAPKYFGPPTFAVIVAIEWPPTTDASKAWLRKHVGD